MSKPARLPLPFKRGLSVNEAAQYIGVGRDTFEAMVSEGKLPGPRFERSMGRRGVRRVWDIKALDDFFDAARKGSTLPRSDDLSDWTGAGIDAGKGERHDQAH